MLCSWNMMSKKRKTAVVLLFLVMLAWIGFIFSNSLKSGDNSADDSGGVVKIVVENVLRLDYEKQSQHFVDTLDHIIRKIAHFSEFAVLSFVAFFLYLLTLKKLSRVFFVGVITSFSVGCIDEFLQLFSDGRACRFTDILIDSAGGLTALLILTLIAVLIRKKRGSDFINF